MGAEDLHVPQAPDFARRVADSFARQGAMATIGARLARVAPGEVEIELDFQENLTQQDGFVHGGIIAAILDSACGYAAYSLMPPDAAVLTVEYKVNFLLPARGERFRARGAVVKTGQTLSVCTGEAYAVDARGEKLIATMTATMITARGRGDVPGG
jgi:uncharacterized protein (TIGR00369 family)